MDTEKLEEFLTKRSLYEGETFTIDDFESLVLLLQGKINIDIFCPECKEKRIYQAVPNKIKIHAKRTMVQTLIDGLDEEIYASIAEQDRAEDEEQYQIFIRNNRITNITYLCSKDKTHIMTFIIMLENEKIMKIGQYPSYRDLENPQIKKYRKILGDFYPELSTAIRLYTAHVGIGSFVYLRRIIEKLVYDAFKEAEAAGALTEQEFEYRESQDGKKYRNGIEEKIKLLKGFLPDMITNQPQIYGIVSKGIHELSEDECLRYFPVLKDGIVMILNDIFTKKENEKAVLEYKKSLNGIISDLK